MGYYKTAKEAYSEGLWGTDDFQTVAQFAVGYDISKKLKENADAYTYASDAYKEAWENGGSQLMERWYGNENELVNMTHVLEDFQNAGLASSNGNGEWLFKNSDGSMKFKTTAEAAEKLHTSVDNVEVAMSKLEEHGFEFDGIEKSGKLLNDYKDNLDGLKTIYDSLNEGDDKDRIGKLIEGYDSEYEKFQDDMSGLSEDQVVKIKFEYDLATLKQQIQDLKETAYATGDNQDWAAVTVSQKQAIDKLEKQTGVNADNDKGYSGSKDKIKELRSGMKGATEDERAAINEQISAIQTLEQNYLDFKNQGGKLNWEDYLNTAEATKAFEEISENGSLTVDDLKSLFGDGVTIEYTAEITTTPATTQGNGKPEIGDAVTYASGDYYYSSDGKSPTGHQMRGQTVYITKINNAAWAKKKYHIARDKAGAHPLGWVDLSQISGYQDGTKRIPYDQLAELLEDGKDETIVTRDGHILRRMTQGEMVLDNKSTENLWKLAQQPAEYLQEVLLNGMNYQDMVQLPKVDAPGNNITEYAPVNNFVINIDKPNNYPEFYKEMMTRFQNDIKAEKLVQHMTLGKINGQGNLNKYSVKF